MRQTTATTTTPPPSSEERPPNILKNASWFSKLFFTWPYPTLRLGLKRPLAQEDLCEILPQDTSAWNSAHFAEIWKEERRRSPDRPSLHLCLLGDFLKSTWIVQPLMMAAFAAKIAQAAALGELVRSFEEDSGDAGAWALCLVGGGLVILMEHHHVFFVTWRKGSQLRVACVASIYSKSLRLSSTHRATSASTGKIMNLVSNDVDRFLLAALFCSYAFWSPVQSVAVLVVGWISIGPAFSAGFALLVFGFVPLQYWLGKRFAAFRSEIAAITDRRVTFVSQAAQGARLMKMSGFEWRFFDRISRIRKEEVAQLDRANRLRSLNEALFFMANVLISLVVFFVHLYIDPDNELTPRAVFTVFTLINVLQLEMTKHLSLAVMGLSEVYVSISRIQEYLQFPEMPKASENTSADADADADPDPDIAIKIDGLCCYWNDVRDPNAPIKSSATRDEDSDTNSGSGSGASNADPLVPAIADATVSCERGSLTCIVGTVGCGKSALIQAVAGELPASRGGVSRRGSLAYAAQDPWIMDGTVRENITMGLPSDEDWYDRVVSACGLIPDFAQFLNGDRTVVGDRGVQCSGGQRARIGLARALYRDADVLVCDDPLSAVDAKVGRQLFDQAILGLAVGRGKCVLLATHQHQYVRDSRCVLLADGRIAKIGTYEECVEASNGELTAHEADDAADGLGDAEGEEPTETNEREESMSSSKDSPEIVTAPSSGEAKKDDGENVARIEADKNSSKEKSQTGVVKFQTYVDYVRTMGGWWFGFLMFMLFIITQGSVLATIGMIGRWAELEADEQRSWHIMGIVLGLGCTVIALAIFRANLCFHYTVRASRVLHDNMTKSVLRSKVEFFDTNPLGRILNRFSSDVGSNDDMLPTTLFDFLVTLFIVIGVVATTMVVLPFALVTLPPLGWYFWSVRRIFVTSTRELKRLEGLARSPMFAMLSESLSGVSTIRANGAEDFFTRKFQAAHDAHTRAFFLFIACSRWVGFRMDAIMFVLMSVVTLLAVLFHTQRWFAIDPAILGLAISMLLQLAGLFQWCIRQSAEVVNQFVAVERVLDFGKLEPEAALEVDGDKDLLASSWPTKGAIDVRDLAVRYRPALPLALNGATFSIEGGRRLGVVGRTGGGKSTVVQTLFRLLEAEHGTISIDGTDVSKIGLHTLRTKISVIPQVPTLFSGCTIRENLDLFGIHSDTAIKAALEDVHLSKMISELPNGYDSMVSEGGSNFSVGQRQLLCLARAILSKSKILILDEATASVDRRTDQLLQESLQASFGDATIVAVAHRLDTIIDYDKVLVLGAGRVLECDTPARLLRSGGAFSQMVDDTGEATSRDLKQRAYAKEREMMKDNDTSWSSNVTIELFS